MKADLARIQGIAKAWPPGLRLVLLHGQDASASRDHADQVARQFADPGNPAAVELLSGSELAKDPQALVAAAGALSMFGDRTVVRIDGLEEECLAAVEALLAGPAGNPVIAVAGALKKGSKLLALAEKSDMVAALVSYEPGRGDANRLVGEIAAGLGLRPSRDAAQALFDAAGGDRVLIRRELEKLALYLDVADGEMRPLELADVAAVGVGIGDAAMHDLVAAVSSGRAAQVADLLARHGAGVAIPLLRAMERRLGLLLTLRAAVEAGASPRDAVDSARPPIFWKEKDAVTAEVAAWTTPLLAQSLHEVLQAERAIKSAGSLGDGLADQLLLNMARRAAAGRRRSA